MWGWARGQARLVGTAQSWLCSVSQSENTVSEVRELSFLFSSSGRFPVSSNNSFSPLFDLLPWKAAQGS